MAKKKTNEDVLAAARNDADQLAGVLVCTIATAEGVAEIPPPIRHALWAAGRLAQDLRQRLDPAAKPAQ